MNTIGILTYERTGSGWLCNAFDTQDYISTHEIFSDDPTLFFLNTQKLLAKIYKVSPYLLSTLCKIYHTDNFFIDNQTYIAIKNKILSNNNLYNIELLTEIKNILFKFFPQHIQKNITIKDIENICNIIIINYRKNILKTFISLEIAKTTGVWYSKQKRIVAPKKIIWNEKQYLAFYQRINNILSDFEKIDSHKIYLSYEELHENVDLVNNQDKINYLQNKLKLKHIDISLNNINFFEIQNNKKTLEEYSPYFINHLDYIASIKKIPLYTNINI
jgi:LPS sulfotransferase NodH